MLFFHEAVCIPLRDPYCLPTLVVFWFRDKAAYKRLCGRKCSSGKTPPHAWWPGLVMMLAASRERPEKVRCCSRCRRTAECWQQSYSCSLRR